MRKRIEADHNKNKLFYNVQETHENAVQTTGVSWLIALVAYANSLKELGTAFQGPVSLFCAGFFLFFGTMKYMWGNDAFSILKANISEEEIQALENDDKELRDTCRHINDHIINRPR